MSRAGSVVLTLAALTIAPALSAQVPQGRPDSYREQARVDRVVVDAHVVDRRGEAISDLAPEDFLVKVDGRAVPLESAEWVPADVPEVPTLPGAAETEDSGRPRPAPGRLIVFFFQTDYDRSRIVGLLRMSLQAKQFLDKLLPTDRVAVVSYDSHLKLRQDFTSDRRKLDAALFASIKTGEPPPDADSYSPSLAQNFDFEGARAAATPERALFLTARALAPIPGGKSMLYFGWGFGTLGGVSGPFLAERRDYARALRALAAARVSIFTLDVTQADYHSLETSLQVTSDLTGGIYQKTHIFGAAALERVRHAIAGRYVLVFVKPPGKRGQHAIAVALASRKGEVRARQYYED
jgi:VWFA-related protein